MGGETSLEVDCPSRVSGSHQAAEGRLWSGAGSVGAVRGGCIFVQMESSGSERRLRGKSLGQMMEKTAISLAPQCRTRRTSLPWPHRVHVHSGPLAALLSDLMAVGPQEPWGFGRASSRCFKIGATGTWLGQEGETVGHFCATSQKHPRVLCSWHHLLGVPSSAHTSAVTEVWNLNNRIFLFL